MLFGVALDKRNMHLLLKNFNTLSGIRIAYCNQDYSEYIAQPQSICEFCTILRKDHLAHKRCLECDKQAFEAAADCKGLYLYECHAGITEGVAPVIIEDKLLGYLMMGQTLKSAPDDRSWERVRSICMQYNVDLGGLREAYYKLPYVELERIQAAARIMDMSAKYIHLSKLVKIQEPVLLEKVKEFMDLNLSKNVSIREMSQQFNISSSYLSHIFKTEFKMSLTKYLQEKRILKAKEILEETDTEISVISEAVGFDDPNYFARVFKKLTGCNASDYRTNIRKKAELC